MLKVRVQNIMLLVAVLGTVGCSHRNRMQIDTSTPRVHTHAPIVAAPVERRPVIQEEILIHREERRDSNAERISAETTSSQGSARETTTTVDVPVNRPVLVENSGSAESDAEEVVSREIHERMPFPEEEYRYIKKRGSSNVSGKVYLENSATGEEIVKNKIKLWLNPVTSYSKEWYEESYLNGYKLAKADKRLYNYLKFTYSNSGGHFDFFGVPAGAYYLTATVHCGEECGYAKPKSILLVKEIRVGRGTTSVDLTKTVP